jgi:hypothetical protein
MKTDNLMADAIVRARQIAAGAIKDHFRSEGRKLSEWCTGDHRKAIGEYLARHPEIVERAQADIERWILAGWFGKDRRSKMLTKTPIERR